MNLHEVDRPLAIHYIAGQRLEGHMRAPRRFLLCVGCLALLIFSTHLPPPAQAQGSAGSDATIELRSLINLPTAGVIPHRHMALDIDFFHAGGVLFGFTAGVLDRLLLGISYGGTGIIGSGSPSWNKFPGVGARFRFLDETVTVPALALGIDTQGKGTYQRHLGRYSIKSPGLYVVGSKNYSWAGFLSVHGGINVTLERGDDDGDPSLFMGVEKTLGPVVSCAVEYDFALNDSDHRSLGRGRGYLNLGLRATVGGGLTLAIDIEDIVRNQQRETIGNRAIRLEYVRVL